MSTKTSTRIRPWAVGQEAVVIVGVQGVVDAMGDGTITVNGLTLPTRLNQEHGVRYLSMVWPEGDETTCSREHCAGACSNPDDDETEAEERATRLARAISDEHDATHDGPFMFCAAAVCQAVTR